MATKEWLRVLKELDTTHVMTGECVLYTGDEWRIVRRTYTKANEHGKPYRNVISLDVYDVDGWEQDGPGTDWGLESSHPTYAEAREYIGL